MYDLLPKGVEITSTKEEIINSLKITDKYGYNHILFILQIIMIVHQPVFPQDIKNLKKIQKQ